MPHCVKLAQCLEDVRNVKRQRQIDRQIDRATDGQRWTEGQIDKWIVKLTGTNVMGIINFTSFGILDPQHSIHLCTFAENSVLLN